MKSQRSSFLRSAQISHRRAFGIGGRTLIESRRFARAQVVDTRIDPSLERGKGPVGRDSAKAGKEQPSGPIDMEKLLHFSQQLYAHALTLQEVIRNEGQVTYEVLRPRCDRQAAQQFEIFYHTFKQSSGSRETDAEFRE
jgi:hypothetical protein